MLCLYCFKDFAQKVLMCVGYLLLRTLLCTERSNMCRIFVAENLALHRKFHDVYCVRYIHTACNPVLLHEKVLSAWNLIPQKVPLVVAELEKISPNNFENYQ